MRRIGTNKVVVLCPRRGAYIIFIARTRPPVYSLLTYCTHASMMTGCYHWFQCCRNYILFVDFSVVIDQQVIG